MTYEMSLIGDNKFEFLLKTQILLLFSLLLHWCLFIREVYFVFYGVSVQLTRGAIGYYWVTLPLG